MIPKDLLSYLSDPKEQKVIELRFGLKGNEPHTLSEVGKKLNHSREKIRNIEMLALKHLKDASKKRKTLLKQSIPPELLLSLTKTIEIYVARDDFKQARYSHWTASELQGKWYKPEENIETWVLNIIELALRFHNKNNDIEELLTEGLLGLDKAVYHYNRVTEEKIDNNNPIKKWIKKGRNFNGFASVIIEKHLRLVTT